MGRLRFVLLLILFGVEVLPVEKRPPQHRAAEAYPTFVVPALANIQGQFGAFFKTRVAITNPTSFNFPIEVTLYNKDGFVGRTNIDIAAGQTLNYSNFLQDVFHTGGAGAVRLDSWIGPPEGSPDYSFLVTSEVYTDGPNGKYKTIVAAGPPLDAISQSYAAFSAGINVDNNNRTNIGCFNNTSEANNVLADLYDSNGSSIGTYSLSLPPEGWLQMPMGSPVSGGAIKWRAGGPAYCYAVVVDNTSNDGTFIPATNYIP
jgi:hypothetical protein